MKKIVLAILLVILMATGSLSVALAKPAVPPPKDIEKAVFIHYKAPAKPDWAGPKKQKEGEGYQLFRGGVKWPDTALPVPYLINTDSVPSNIDPTAAFNEIAAAFEEWDVNTSKELFGNAVGTTNIASASLDGANIITWAGIANPDVIAVTTFWYYRSTKELVEFDMEFNTQFAWGIDPDGEGIDSWLTDAMDIRNITTHEAGHTLALNDLYQDQYAKMTMYGYSLNGEVKKISLEQGDIAGLHKLYGN